MVQIIFRHPPDDDYIVDVNEGDSLMTGGLFAGVRGIEGLCGGAMACGTCHLHIDDRWRERLGAAGPSELELLDALDNRTAASRLGCQIMVTADLEGMVVTVATG